MEFTHNQLEAIDRSARAYGWEVGRGKPIGVVLKTSKGNPFIDPNWRDHILNSEGGNMKNVFAFIAGGIVALAGVVLGNGVKTDKPAVK